MKFGIVERPLYGNRFCGDACFIKEFGSKILICVVDGLGHGMPAATAAQKAIAYVAENYENGPTEIISGCHQALQGTRGAVMGVALVEPEQSILTYVGVGNIGIRVVAEKNLWPLSTPGIVGGNFGRLKEETVPYHSGDLVIMYSDGISEKFDVFDYPESLHNDPQKLAERIARGFARENDDSIIVVAR